MIQPSLSIAVCLLGDRKLAVFLSIPEENSVAVSSTGFTVDEFDSRSDGVMKGFPFGVFVVRMEGFPVGALDSVLALQIM